MATMTDHGDASMPEYLYRHASSMEHYTADIFVVWCFDDRFREAQMGFLTHVNIGHRDPESPAGGGKIFFDPEKESDREYYCRELEKSIALHHAKEVWLFTHHDCGACGGFGRFCNSRDEELLHHINGGKIAREFIQKRFSAIEKVRTFFVDERGVIETTHMSEASGDQIHEQV